MKLKTFWSLWEGTRIQNFCELVQYWYRNISLEEKHARNSDGFHFLFLAGVLSNVVLSYGAARRKGQWSRRLRDVKQQSIPRHNQLVLSTLIKAYIEIK